MIDIRTLVVTELQKVLTNVQFELAVQTPTLPCITYKVIENYETDRGDTLLYSNVTLQIKIWAGTVNEINQYSHLIDSYLRPIGLHRTFYTDMVTDNVLQGVLQYQGKLREYIGGNSNG